MNATELERKARRAARQARYVESQRALGRRRAEYWVTPAERLQLDLFLRGLREKS